MERCLIIRNEHIPVYDEIPKGWKILEGALTAPRGYKWITNGKSIFAKERKIAFLDLHINNK